MNPVIDIDNASSSDDVPEPDSIRHWISAALMPNSQAELAVRIVDRDEIQQLNRDYRQQDKPTNVLSFPTELPDDIEIEHLGDIVICADVVHHEAQEQNKSLAAHWAHMLIHGTLHLRGYDHIEEADALVMEALETKLLNELGYPPPYETFNDGVADDDSTPSPLANGNKYT